MMNDMNYSWKKKMDEGTKCLTWLEFNTELRKGTAEAHSKWECKYWGTCKQLMLNTNAS